MSDLTHLGVVFGALMRDMTCVGIVFFLEWDE